MAIFTCKNCGKPFDAKPSKKPAHCSRECQKATGRKKRMRICQQCSKEFEVNTSAKEGKYCSLECSSESQRVRVVHKCSQCGKEFMDQPSEQRKFCSHKCFTDSIVGHKFNQGRTSPFNRKPDRSVLIDLYETKQLSTSDIGKQLGVKGQTVCVWLRRDGIKVRPSDTRFERGMAPGNKMPVPTKDELIEFYMVKSLSLKDIGEAYGVSAHTAGSWFSAYGIPVGRLSRKLYERGIEFPTKEELFDMIHDQRLSYAQVAAKYGVDQSLVPTWLDKYGIDRHKTWHDLHNNPNDVAAMRALYDEGLSLAEIGQMYGVGKGPVKLLFLANGVEIRKDGWQGKRFETKRGELVRSTYEREVADWLHEQGIDYIYEPPLPFSNQGSADFWANGWYIEVWGMATEKYLERQRVKLSGYADAKAPLIEIPASAFRDKERMLLISILQHILGSPSQE